MTSVSGGLSPKGMFLCAREIGKQKAKNVAVLMTAALFERRQQLHKQSQIACQHTCRDASSRYRMWVRGRSGETRVGKEKRSAKHPGDRTYPNSEIECQHNRSKIGSGKRKSGSGYEMSGVDEWSHEDRP